METKENVWKHADKVRVDWIISLKVSNLKVLSCTKGQCIWTKPSLGQSQEIPKFSPTNGPKPLRLRGRHFRELVQPVPHTTWERAGVEYEVSVLWEARELIRPPYNIDLLLQIRICPLRLARMLFGKRLWTTWVLNWPANQMTCVVHNRHQRYLTELWCMSQVLWMLDWFRAEHI